MGALKLLEENTGVILKTWSRQVAQDLWDGTACK